MFLCGRNKACLCTQALGSNPSNGEEVIEEEGGEREEGEGEAKKCY